MARLLSDGTTSTVEEFRDETLACHRRMTRTWPRALGTPPWAVRRELERLTGRRHRVRLARWSPAAAYDRLMAAGGALYVGSRALPRHVLLVLPPGVGPAGEQGAASALRCYQPSHGGVVALPREELVAGTLQQAGWPHVWFTVGPVGPTAPAAPPPTRR